VPIGVAATGDLFAVGDGTLIATDFGNRDGDQEATVLRIDPRSEQAETVYYEYPLVVEGYPAIAINLRFQWDPSSLTAWVGLPGPGLPVVLPPDPDRTQQVDAFHIADQTTRGPTISRQAFTPYVTATTQSLVDGSAWVNVFDDQPIGGLEEIAIAPSGIVWMLSFSYDETTQTGTSSIIRWRPGDTFADVAPFERNVAETQTRLLAGLDDNSVAYLDTNIGGRIRVFTFP
jgi:hypothetical protein